MDEHQAAKKESTRNVPADKRAVVITLVRDDPRPAELLCAPEIFNLVGASTLPVLFEPEVDYRTRACDSCANDESEGQTPRLVFM
jgi:hypothetical protein